MAFGKVLIITLYFLQLFLPVQNDAPEGQEVDDSSLPVGTRIRQRIMNRLPARPQILTKKEICYDMIGCFDVARKRSLKRTPQSPLTVDTKFWLYNRQIVNNSLPLPIDQLTDLGEKAEILNYDDDLESLNLSSFDPNKPLKVLIHGFKGSGKDRGALRGVQELLILEDVNVLVVDWEKGAGDDYPTAAANTEVIGRQTAVLLLGMIGRGTSPKKVHIIGFSLGAHIAGCAGDMVKQKGFMVGRITGLDPASPLFKSQFLRESSTKLDSSDADFVDVIHTDGSPVFTDGFGILSPIGHVDFFPNGGREQPGCHDGRGSVVVSTIEGTINSSIACSHVRAWQLFLESLVNLQQENGCQFVGYPCQSSGQFGRGQCLGDLKRCRPDNPRCNVMGMGASSAGARGVLYLSTRGSPPYCGRELQSIVHISVRTKNTRGYLHMRLSHGTQHTNFRFTNELADAVTGGEQLSAVAVASPGSISRTTTPELTAVLSYQSLEFQHTRPNANVFVGAVSVVDGTGGHWWTCQDAGQLKYIPGTSFSTLTVNLTSIPCKS